MNRYKIDATWSGGQTCIVTAAKFTFDSGSVVFWDTNDNIVSAFKYWDSITLITDM